MTATYSKLETFRVLDKIRSPSTAFLQRKQKSSHNWALTVVLLRAPLCRKAFV